MAKLVALLRVKDGFLFIREWLKVMEHLVDEIVVVDNGSTDGTLEILKNHNKVSELLSTIGFNEGRDKILLYELARKRRPDWCIWLDVDEIFEQRMNRLELEKMMSHKSISKYLFRRYDFINDKSHYFIYANHLNHTFGFSRTMWREQASGFFSNLFIHNGDIQGITGRRSFSKFRIKHLGYVNAEYVKRKTENYIAVDPASEKMYLQHFIKKPGLKVKWVEYEEHRIKVTIQLGIYYLAFLIITGKSFLLKKLKTQFKIPAGG